MRTTHIKGVILAVAVIALSAGLAVARDLPSEADNGLSTARGAAGRDVPGAAEQGGFLTEASAHGGDVSDAAQADTPGEFDSHGDYVSSVATGWGETIASEASGGASDAAADGLSHQP